MTTNSSLSDANYSVPIPQYAEGQSLTSIWAVRSLGIDPTTGKEIFLNRDGSVTDKWDASQEVAVGNTEPKFNGSFGLNVTYKIGVYLHPSCMNGEDKSIIRLWWIMWKMQILRQEMSTCVC